MVHHNITSYFSLVFPDIHECATIFGAYFPFSTLYFFSKAPSRETGLIHIALSTMDGPGYTVRECIPFIAAFFGVERRRRRMDWMEVSCFVFVTRRPVAPP